MFSRQLMPPLIATAKERSKVSSPDKLRAKIASQSTSAQHSMEASTSMPAGSALNAVRLSSVTSPSAGVAPILADSAPSALHTHTLHTRFMYTHTARRGDVRAGVQEIRDDFRYMLIND